MKIFLLISTFLILIFSVNGQTKSVKFSFSSINTGGLLAGAGGEFFSLQTINGFSKEKWFAGLGTGIDFYGQRSIPLFIDIRRDLMNKPNKAFVYADAGINFRWLNQSKGETLGNSTSSPGIYYDLGLGWKIKAFHSTHIILSAGYSYKQINEKIPAYWWAPVQHMGQDDYESYNYKFRRITIKMGIQL